jgi:hypothetical protein
VEENLKVVEELTKSEARLQLGKDHGWGFKEKGERRRKAKEE